MSVAAKLVGFTVALVATFGLAYGVGSAVGPIDRPATTTSATTTSATTTSATTTTTSADHAGMDMGGHP